MSRYMTTLTPAFHAGYYEHESDPWHFETSPYEKAKYAATLAALPKARYRNVFEVGCSIGVQTRLLAQRSDALQAYDVVPSALETARRNCAAHPHVRFALAEVPDAWPQEKFDLIMLSEVLFFFDRTDLARIVAHVRDTLLPGGDVVVVNWLGETNFPLTGDEASDGFIAGASDFLRRGHGERTGDYRLDVLTRGMNGKKVA